MEGNHSGMHGLSIEKKSASSEIIWLHEIISHIVF